MASENQFPLEELPPEPDDIIAKSGMRIAVEKTTDGLYRLMFSRPIYFVDLTERNVNRLISKFQSLAS